MMPLASLSRRATARLASSLALVSFVAAPAAAQSLRLTLRDRITGAPVVAPLVAVLDTGGAVLVERLGSRDGEVLLPLTRGGTVRVRIRRIGVRPVLSRPVTVAASGTTTLDLQIERIDEQLPTVTADGTGCRSNPRAEALWERMTIALRSAALRDVDHRAETRLVANFFSSMRSRDLDEIAPAEVTQRFVAGRAFVSSGLSLELGQGQVDTATHDSIARVVTDDRILSSDEFRRRYCFSTPRQDARPGVAEVRFTPVKSHLSEYSVFGSAFIDTVSGEPRRLLFRFDPRSTVPKGLMATQQGGGEFEVRRLEDGSWIVSAWSMRLPLVFPIPTFDGTWVPLGTPITSWHEVFGRVDLADSAANTRIDGVMGAIARARVMQVTVMIAIVRDDDLEPVPAATVVLGAHGEAAADAAGLISVTLPADTTVLLGVSHPGYAAHSVPLHTGSRDTTVVVRLRRTAERAAAAR